MSALVLAAKHFDRRKCWPLLGTSSCSRSDGHGRDKALLPFDEKILAQEAMDVCNNVLVLLFQKKELSKTCLESLLRTESALNQWAREEARALEKPSHPKKKLLSSSAGLMGLWLSMSRKAEGASMGSLIPMTCLGMGSGSWYLLSRQRRQVWMTRRRSLGHCRRSSPRRRQHSCPTRSMWMSL